MKPRIRETPWVQVCGAALILLLLSCPCTAQTAPQERVFPQSKSEIEKALKSLQPALSGRLPTLDGFATANGAALDHFKRGFYQCSVQVSPNASGGSLVRVTAKVTAWYGDADPSRSGYRVLTSNGRLEADLLTQLEDALAPGSASAGKSGNIAPPSPPRPASSTKAGDREPMIDAPQPNLPKTQDPMATALSRIAKEKAQGTSPAKPDDKRIEELRGELKNLQEILRNQSHPTNLAAVKNPGTPVLSSPRLDAKILFYTAVEDEFEILDTTADWVHVRISGLSRGWIRRSSLEMPDAERAVAAGTPSNIAPDTSHAEMFHITREETAPFSGDWDPLRGKTVKIISVQKTDESAQDTPQAKLNFVTSLLGDKYKDLTQSSPAVEGVMLIFDSADGGMMAATLPALQQWKAGRLSNDALWRQCYFDPPDTFGLTANR